MGARRRAGTILLLGVLGGCAKPTWQHQLVTRNAAGTDAGNGASGYVDGLGDFGVSADGTKVVFTSEASDLGPTDTVATCDDSNCPDIYLRDLTTGTTRLVSVNAAGTNGGDDASFLPVISPDGTKVAFISEASDLLPGAPSGINLYLRDLTTSTTTQVSVSDGITFFAFDAVFSADSTKLAFKTSQSHPGSGDTNNVDDVYVRNLATGTTTLVSTNAAGTNGGNHFSGEPLFNPTGNAIAFESLANNLGSADPGTDSDMYLRDLTTGRTTLVTVNAWGTDGLNDDAGYSLPAFSPDGTKIAFTTTADNLGPGDTHATDDVYVRDLVHGATTLVSTSAAGGDSGAGGSFGVDGGFSGDSTLYAFHSDAPDLVATDTNGNRDAFVRNLTTETTTMLSLNAQGTDGANARTTPEAFSPDGQQVLLLSWASDLGPADNDDLPDLYLRDLAAGSNTLVTTNAAEPGIQGFYMARFVFAEDRIVFAADTAALGPTDTNRRVDVYAADLTPVFMTYCLDQFEDRVEGAPAEASQ